MMMTKYRKKPVVIDAFKFDGTEEQLNKYNVLNDYELELDDGVLLDASGQFSIQGENFRAEKGDWIVLGGIDEIRVFSDKQFHKFYERIPEDTNPAMLTRQERDYMAAVLDEFLNDDGIQNETTVHDVVNDKSENKHRIRDFGWKLRNKLIE